MVIKPDKDGNTVFDKIQGVNNGVAIGSQVFKTVMDVMGLELLTLTLTLTLTQHTQSHSK